MRSRLHFPFFPLLPLLLLMPAAAAGLTPRLVKDINPIVRPLDSSPADLLTLGDLTFFVADDGETGRQLWRTDGSAAGTYRLSESCAPGCLTNPEYLAHTDRSVFFVAQIPGGVGLTKDLWVSGGTPATTFRLAGPLDFPVPIASWSRWIPGQRVLYFAASDRVHGVELWRSDGTPGGTYPLADLRPGALGSSPRELTELKGQLYFTADDGRSGPALWKSDGTAQGTQVVRDPLPSSSSHAGPRNLRVAGGALYFVAPAPGIGTELWMSDGTTRGTAPLADLVRGPASPSFYDFSVAGSRLFFVAETAAQGQELWATDGTPRGTRALTSFPLAAAFVSNSYLVALPQAPLGGRIVFVANDGPHGLEPWVSDGTPAGTRLLRDVCPGPCHGTLSAGVASGNRVYFPAGNGVRGLEPWITDGTPEGTRLIRDLCRGSCSSDPHAPFAVGQGLFFIAQDDAEGDLNYWRTDGTAAGTVRLTDFTGSEGIANYAGQFPGAGLGNRLIFAARDPRHGRELWQSDGTAAGTQLLADLNAHDLGGSNPRGLRPWGDGVLFFADDGVHGSELWKSDGTAAGTALVHEFNPGPGPRSGTEYGFADQAAGKLFFFMAPNGNDHALWCTDGTEAGTLRLTLGDVTPYSYLLAAGGTLFFGGDDPDHGVELWKSDGTVAGTVRVADLVPGDGSSYPSDFIAFQGRLYFTARTGSGHRGLFASDGSAAGTVLVKPVEPEPDSGSGALTEHAGRLWFFAAGFPQRELWSSDGTAAGTVLAAELPAGLDASMLDSIASTGSRLFLYGRNTTFGLRLWISDGSASGTRQILSLPEYTDAAPVALHGALYFTGGQGPFDTELWRSDGTVAGTAPVRDRNGQPIIAPAVLRTFEDRVVLATQDGELWQTEGTPGGTLRIRPADRFLASPVPELVPAGRRLFFRGYENASGTEIWALDP